MRNEKLISVVIPCYNHEKYIRKTVLSVLQQTYTNIEVLVADDCSTDNSAAVLRTIQDPRLKLFFFEKNQGTVFTLNFLLKQAKGDYIATLGSDDYFKPDKLEKQLEVMENDPELGAVFSWAEIVDGNDRPYEQGSALSVNVFPVHVFQEDNKSQGAWIRYFFLDGNHLCHSSAMVRRRTQDEVGLYRPAYRQLHDFDYWLRILCRYPIYVIPENLTGYRRADENSSVSASKSVANTIRLYNEMNSVFYELFREINTELFVQAFWDMLSGSINNSDNLLVKEKYLVLRQLSVGGCKLRNASHTYFASYMDEDVLESMSEQERVDVLKLYYEDTAQVAIEYPDMTLEISAKTAIRSLLSAVKKCMKKQVCLIWKNINERK